MSVIRSLLVGIISSTSILFTPSYLSNALAQLAPQEISAIAKPSTVRIDGTEEGSGVIIERAGNTYTVLTNWHVVETSGQYTVQTHDGQQHSVEYSQIQKLSDGVDLALLKFTSENRYQIAELGESDELGEGETIYLAGYPGQDQILGEEDRFYRFNSLNINAILPISRQDGYSLAYGGENFSGMSGSPIFDSDGNVIGINGIAYQDIDGKARSNYAVPINTYVELAALLDDESSPLGFVLSKLDPIPVFTIADEKGAPLVASKKEEGGGKVAGVFISPTDANKFIDNLKIKHPELAAKVKVVPVSLGEIYKISESAKDKTNPLDFAYIPEGEEINSAKVISEQMQTSYTDGVPLFVAKVGEEKRYLTIEQNSKTIVPFFFEKHQLDLEIAKFQRQNPELSDGVEIEIILLEELIEILNNNVNKYPKNFSLIPTEESKEFLQTINR